MRRFIFPSFPLIFDLLSCLFPFIFYLSTFILPLSCSQPTDSPDDGAFERERISVSGSISEDTVWESGKEYYVTGDVTVKQGATLTIQPDVVVKFAHERADDGLRRS